MDDPLLTTLLDLDAELAWEQPLIIGGGYGLYLKQLYLIEHPEIQTLFPLSELPEARTTKDIDLILRAEVVTDSNIREQHGVEIELWTYDPPIPVDVSVGERMPLECRRRPASRVPRTD